MNQALETYSSFKSSLLASDCARCGLSASRTQIVVDRGNPKAKILLIGEAPGEQEDLSGQAFVGRAGRLLDKLFFEIGLNTNEDTLIVNVVKCRPPKNRAPFPLEAESCSPYLEKQIRLVRPNFILLLGATALKYFAPERASVKIKDYVGRFFQDERFPGARLMSLYHPAYLLRDPRKNIIMLEHLKQFKNCYSAN